MNNRSLHRSRKVAKNQGFSLVEVVLAIGVTSFALLGMVALLPMGLKTSHQAADAMTQTQIVQYARNEMEMTPFANLSSWAGNTLYFDNQGLPTTVTDPEQIYTVTFTVGNVKMASIPPGGTSASSATDVLGSNVNLTSSAADAQLVQVIIVNRTVPGTAGKNIFPIVVPNAGF